jgi:hypothetical protein
VLFFQWIDGSDKFDPRYLLLNTGGEGDGPKISSSVGFHLPPNPPPMMDEEKAKATNEPLEKASLCDCGDLTVLPPSGHFSLSVVTKSVFFVETFIRLQEINNLS